MIGTFYPGWILTTVAVLLSVPKTSPASGPAPVGASIRVMVVDEMEHPLEGAVIGPYIELVMPEQSRIGHAVVKPNAEASWVRTDARGQANLPVGGEGDVLQQVWVYHESSGRAGLFDFELTDTSSPIKLTVRPACAISGRVSSSRLTELGQELIEPWVHVNAPDGGAQLLCFVGADGRFSFSLPPGKYNDFILFARNAYPVRRPVNIGDDDRDLHLETIDLLANYRAELIGKPAPELRRIKEWKNGGPVELNDLRGKVVLLDFWGYWCPPCVAQMPGLMSLHDRYADEGLVVIAVHDDSAESIEDMDQKLMMTREKLWRGRDLPFLVALDGGGRTVIPGPSGRQTSGATTAAYGVDSWPTTVLINRDGVLIGDIDLTDEDAESKIALLLGVSPKPTKP